MTSGGPKIVIFGKVWEWLPLVWKKLGFFGGVFWSYLGPLNSHIIKNPKNDPKNIRICFLTNFLDFLLYGSWEALDSSKILPRGTPTISTPGEAIPRLFQKSKFGGPLVRQISSPGQIINFSWGALTVSRIYGNPLGL